MNWAGRAHVFGYDIVAYSTRDHHAQKSVVALTSAARSQAKAATADPDPVWCDAGDGGYLIIRGDVRSPMRALDAFVSSVAAQNLVRDPRYRVALRYAIHVGPVEIFEENGDRQVVGDAVNECARLLAGIPKANVGQVVASGGYRDELVMFDPMQAPLFAKLPDTVDKHGRSHPAWNVRKAPIYGIDPEAAPDESAGGSAGAGSRPSASRSSTGGRGCTAKGTCPRT